MSRSATTVWELTTSPPPLRDHVVITVTEREDLSPLSPIICILPSPEGSVSLSKLYLSVDNDDDDNDEGLRWELQQEMPDQFQLSSSQPDCLSLLQTGQEKVWRVRAQDLREDYGDSLHLQIQWEV